MVSSNMRRKAPVPIPHPKPEMVEWCHFETVASKADGTRLYVPRK